MKAGFPGIATILSIAASRVARASGLAGFEKPMWLSEIWTKEKPPLRRLGRADETRGRHAAGDRPQDAGPGPEHAFEGLPAVRAAKDVVNHGSLLERRKAPFRRETRAGAGLFPVVGKKSRRRSRRTADDESGAARTRSGRLRAPRTLRSDLINPTSRSITGGSSNAPATARWSSSAGVVEAVRSAIEVQSGLAERNAGRSGRSAHRGSQSESISATWSRRRTATSWVTGSTSRRVSRRSAEPSGVCLSSDGLPRRCATSCRSRSSISAGTEPQEHRAAPCGSTLSSRARPTGARRGRTQGRTARTSSLVRVAAVAAYRGRVASRVVLLASIRACRRRRPPLLPSPPSPTTSSPARRVCRSSCCRSPTCGGDPEQDYFADGLTDDLTTDLSHMPEQLRHRPLDRRRPTRASLVDLKQLGRDLGVRYARRRQRAPRRRGDHESTRSSSRPRPARICGPTGSRASAAKLGELLVEAVSRIANALGVQLVNAEALRAIRERPTNPDAADYVMRGSAAWFRGITPDNLAEAIDDFNKALRLDPNNEQALSRKATMEVIGLIDLGIGRERFNEVIKEAEAELDRAIALQPNDALAHLMKGVIAKTPTAMTFGLRRQIRPSRSPELRAGLRPESPLHDRARARGPSLRAHR